MKTLFYNAKVYIEKGHFEEAVLVNGEHIESVGSSKKLLSDADDTYYLYNCNGLTMIPGLNDSHMHFMQFGETMHQAKIDDVKSIDEMIEVCRDFARSNPDSVSEGMHSIGWNQDNFPDKRMPDRHDLDRISTDYPIILERVCGHILSANTRAIELLGLTKHSPQYPDGTFFLEQGGYPNGIFAANACFYAKSIIPDFTADQRVDILLDAMKYAVAHGITSVQSNDVGAMPLSIEGSFDLFHRVYATGKACIRYRHQVNFRNFDEFKACVEEGEYANASALYPDSSWLTLGPLKIYKDGSLGARTAFVSRGYISDPDNHGSEWIKKDELSQYCSFASEHDIQVIVHCIGDAAMDQVIDCFGTESNPLRHGLVHCQISDRPLVNKIINNNILAFVQPVFLDSDMDILDELIGRELAETSYAFGTLLRMNGLRTSYGTDCPVEDCNPFPNIYCAVSRKHRDGTPVNGFVPSEKVSVEDAIDAYTVNSAYAEFMEDRLGRIKPGYLADLTLLDRDIFTCNEEDIKDILPVMTMTGGKIVYESNRMI